MINTSTERGSDPTKLAAAIALDSTYGLRIIYIYTGALGIEESILSPNF
jgi:hypothetical protein